MAGGRPGRMPKPIEQHHEDGTYREDRHGPLPAVQVGGNRLQFNMPKCPATVAKHDDGAELWDEIATCVEKLGAIREADAISLEAMALALLTLRDAQTVIADQGILVLDRFGFEKANPAIAIRDKAASEFRAWASRFGMTPSDRLAIGLSVMRGQTMEQAMAGAIGASPRAQGEPDDNPGGDIFDS